MPQENRMTLFGKQNEQRSQLVWLRRVLVLLILIMLLPHTPAPLAEAQTGTQIGYGTSAAGTISAAQPTASYTFNGLQDDTVTLDVFLLGQTLQPNVQLISPDGGVLATSQHNRLIAHHTNAHIARRLPVTGTYTITVSGQNGTEGDYILRLLGRNVVPSTPLEYDITVNVSIGQNPPRQYFSFEAEDCPTTLIVTNLTSGDPYTFPFVVKVRNQEGREVALLAGGDAQEDRITVAALSGRYEIEVWSDDPAVAGQISLLITCAADAPGCDALSGGTTACPPCPSCPRDFEDGDVPACPVMDLTPEPAGDGVRLTWNAVPGTEHYWVHIYGLREDDEVYLGAAGAPGSATDFLLDHLFEGFWGFRFVVEAIQGDVPICSDETFIARAERVPACPELNLTGRITDNEDRWAQWTWDAYPDADGYFATLEAIMPDDSRILIGAATFGPEVTTWDTHHSTEAVDSDTFRLTVQVILDDEIVCIYGAIIEFQSIGETEYLADCADFTTNVTLNADSSVTFSWSAYPGAEQYWFYILNVDGTMVEGYPVTLPPDQLSATVTLPPGVYTFGVGPWTAASGAFCLEGSTFQVGSAPSAPCLVRTERSNVQLHVGPGRHRSVFALLNPGQDYLVIGQANDDSGQIWWQIDKTVVPGHEAVLSLWVAASDVTAIGDCDELPNLEPPPLVPDGSGEQPPGVWLGCGSCDTCGHPGECVTSPTGECLWDPATCTGQIPEGELPEGQIPPEEPPLTCVFVTGAVNPPGLGTAGPITSGNCISEIPGNYRPGTTVRAQANPTGGCWLDFWSGCGASGSANPVTFTANSNCTITANIQCIQ